MAERSAVQGPEPLVLGDTFDHLNLTLETTDQDLAFAFTTRPAREWGSPPPWAPPPGRTVRLLVRRGEVVRAWHEAEPHFDRLLKSFGR